MIWALAPVIWILLCAGAYLAMSREMLRCIAGLAIIGSAVNLMLLATGRLTSPLPAIIRPGETVLEAGADPLPQALVLTAIVIGFALVCFSFLLVMRIVRQAGSDDTSALRHAEPAPADPVKPPLPRG